MCSWEMWCDVVLLLMPYIYSVATLSVFSITRLYIIVFEHDLLFFGVYLEKTCVILKQLLFIFFGLWHILGLTRRLVLFVTNWLSFITVFSVFILKYKLIFPVFLTKHSCYWCICILALIFQSDCYGNFGKFRSCFYTILIRFSYSG